MSDIDLQEFGRLQAEVIGLRRDNDRLLELLEKLTTKLDAFESRFDRIEDQLSQARGGWRTLMWLGGASASIGGLIVAALAHFLGKGPT